MQGIDQKQPETLVDGNPTTSRAVSMPDNVLLMLHLLVPEVFLAIPAVTAMPRYRSSSGAGDGAVFAQWKRNI